MKGNELVWRSLADHALRGERTWSNVGDLAYDAGVPSSTAYLALERLESNGTVDRYRPGGFSVVSIEKLLTMLCAWRNLDRDTMIRTTSEEIEPFLHSERGPYALGGADAANALLGGHAVSSFREHIVYLPGAGEVRAELARLTPAPDGNVRVLAMDTRAMRLWDGYSTLAQTYADLFATPGWQASEFRHALREKFVRSREWDQEGDRS
ncbi:TrmB family transcriptional regulator [Galbitalea soli]|uniref:TrmB family transcriptional regulator n=1 Tax=Galbitalea soli TaxID=1268042 RepID=A0A7C9PNZ6_9MICO|nr:TrmB family transcriptional regulator [Galbitalea soli]NEM92014.1 TrmB family transcriptional regulator [Galbitalea soli]NYJ32034.1 hypothetical protein [Galbitalea soli]